MEVFKNVLEAVAKLVAPFVPFVAEAAWEELTTNNQQPTTNNKESIHLEDFPVEGLIDEKVLHVMEVLRGEVTAGLAQRAAQRIKIRQPLQSFTSALLEHALKNFPNSERKEFTRLLAEELNVKEIRYGKEMALDTVITEELRLEGEARELMRTIQDARKKAGLKPGEEIVLTVGDTESKRLLDHPVHGHAICAKTSVKNWAYREGAPLSVSVDA